MPTLRRQFGDKGENMAAEFLKKKGCQILDHNWQKKTGELDIVAAKRSGFLGRKLEKIIFVEVKTGVKAEAYFPEQHVSRQKARRLIRTAQLYLRHHKVSPEISWQIDVIAIEFDELAGSYEIRHHENAVWAEK